MYLKLLEETIRELKGEELEDDARATLNLKVELRIDETYIPDMNQRLGVYRRLAAARTEQALEDAFAEVRDRYGPAARVGDQPGRLRVDPHPGRQAARRRHRPGRLRHRL